MARCHRCLENPDCRWSRPPEISYATRPAPTNLDGTTMTEKVIEPFEFDAEGAGFDEAGLLRGEEPPTKDEVNNNGNE